MTKNGARGAPMDRAAGWQSLAIPLVMLFLGLAQASPCPAQTAAGAEQTPPNDNLFLRLFKRFTPQNRDPSAASHPIAPLTALKDGPLEARLRGDARAVEICRAQALRIMSDLRRRVKILDHRPDSWSQDAREVFRQGWVSLADAMLALHSLARYHQDFSRIRRVRRGDSLWIRFAATVAETRAMREFTILTRPYPSLPSLLDEPRPELGLPAQAFSRAQARLLGPGHETEVRALATLARRTRGGRFVDLRQAAEQDARALIMDGMASAPPSVPRLAMTDLRHTGGEAWPPVTPGICTCVEDFLQPGTHDPTLIARLLPLLDPGDILLRHRDGQLESAGQPGYWTQAALYIGTPQERENFFNDGDVKAWTGQQGHDGFESMLASGFPLEYALSEKTGEHGETPRLIEALATGVVFTPLERPAGAEAAAVAVLRPRLVKREKAMALLRAFQYGGRPWDPLADFTSDSALVSGELVYRAFLPGTAQTGLKLPLTSWLGRKMLTPNDIVRRFDETCATSSPEMDLVIFLDGGGGRVVEAGPSEFRKSWRRPKWRL